jgi:phosphoglycerol transferase MdoB-like AlkP superfamily enzyme
MRPGAARTIAAISDILVIALALIAVHTMARIYIWVSRAPGVASLWHTLRSLAAFEKDDLLTIATLTVAVVAVVALLARQPRLTGAVLHGWWWCAVLLAVLAGVNMTAVAWLGSPITWQWIAYADPFNSRMGASQLAQVVDATAVALVVAAVVLLMVMRRLLAAAAAAMAARWGAPVAALVLAVLIGGPTGYAWARHHGQAADAYGRTANPMHRLEQSVLAAYDPPFSRADRDRDDRDYRTGGSALPGPMPVPRRNNIVLIVLESIGARDMLAPDAGLPAITGLRRQGMTFANTYVTTAASSRSAFALVTGRFPLFGYRPETQTLADRRFVTFASRLQQAGYATALFMASELRYASQDRFLAGKGFAVMQDMANIPCDTRMIGSTARFADLDGVTDTCMTDAFLAWHGAQHQRPFFAMLWTNNTHFPYFAPGERGDGRARHAAALREADRQIARIVAALSRSGDLARTSFVIVGDHGEAFNDHGYMIHSNTVFDEEVRVATVLAGAGVPMGGIDNRIASLSDIAPTILDLAGLPPERNWQGHTLLAPTARQRVYFFATSRDYVLGYREGDSKTVLDLTTGSTVRFDLARDPGERHPLALGPDAARAAGRHIAGWVAYQDALYRPGAH